MTALYNVLERVRELENQAPPSPRSSRGEGAPKGADEGQRGDKKNAPVGKESELSKFGIAPHPSLRDTFSPQEAGRREVEPLTPAERDIYDAGLISILKDIHDDIDRATFEAYGWQDLSAHLVGRPGATMPSPHKTEDQEQAEEELLTRLVALNLTRQEEEKRGLVRWLRPDYQIAKLGAKVAKPALEEQYEADVTVIAIDAKPKWPGDDLAQIRIVRDVLAKAVAPAGAEDIARIFDGKISASRKQRVEQVLDTLVATGAARTATDAGPNRYFVPR